MILQGYGMPIDFALNLLAKYIYEKKGVRIIPKPPQTEHEIELFEKMITVVFTHYNVQF
jgi:hypothetical protein